MADLGAAKLLEKVNSMISCWECWNVLLFFGFCSWMVSAPGMIRLDRAPVLIRRGEEPRDGKLVVVSTRLSCYRRHHH
jgi:hypothetical protein